MMKLIAWNIRGLANNSSFRRLKKLIKKNNVSCFAIFEPKVAKGSVNDYAIKFNCLGSISNHEGNIWLFLKLGIKCSVLHITAQYISMILAVGDIDVIIFFMHASWIQMSDNLLGMI